MNKILLCAACLLATPALSENSTGFYVGGDISSFDVDFTGTAVEGDGNAFGAHFGYRYALSDVTFLEGEAFAATLNGDTNTGNTDFDAYYGLTAGFGAYFTDKAYALVFGGLARSKTDNDFVGSQTGRGHVLGLGIGYDFKENQSIALRFSRATFDGTVDDVDNDVIGVRYSYRF